MGEKDNLIIGTETGTESGTGRSGGSDSTNTATATGTATGSGTATATGRPKKIERKTDIKTDVEQNSLSDKKENSEPLAVPDKEQKQKKPKKVRTAKKKKSSIDTTNINKIIVGITETVATRPNCQHWKMDEKEVKSITEPLTAMLSEKEVLQKIEEHSNEIALVTACITVFVPRIFVSVQIAQAKKEEVKKANEHKRKVEQAESTNTKPNGKNDSKRTVAVAENYIADLLPPVS